MNVNHQKRLDHKRNVSGRNLFFQNILLRGSKKTKMLNNWIPKVLHVILKGICSVWKGCEITLTNKYSES